jgi:hypothetical protein
VQARYLVAFGWSCLALAMYVGAVPGYCEN